MNKKSYSPLPNIVVRKRKLKNDLYSLYLDILYKGKRMRENLGLYLVPETSVKDKNINLRTLTEAAERREQRMEELMDEQNISEVIINPSVHFLSYFREVMDRKLEETSRYKDWNRCLTYLESYCNEKTTFTDITPEWCEGFKKHLDSLVRRNHMISGLVNLGERNPLSNRTKNLALNNLEYVIKTAIDENIILTNPMKKVEKYKQLRKEIVCLTWDEVKRLEHTPCRKPLVKNMFLFSCFTGIKIIDIKKLTWGDVHYSDGQMSIDIHPISRKGYKVYIPEQAKKYLGDRGKDDELIFPYYRHCYLTNMELRMWALDAGINKYFTFQASRNTFTSLLISLGCDLHTIGSMLGNKSLKNMRLYKRLLPENPKSEDE